MILLHAADSRKTIKEAAKKQADNLFSSNDNINKSKEHNEATSMNFLLYHEMIMKEDLFLCQLHMQNDDTNFLTALASLSSMNVDACL